MAARSPVIIESSPDQAYPAPSITPDNARPSGNTASTSRSSPQLLSPSAFTRPRAQLLKSGSKAQQVPAGAHAGFASAASIWKVQAIEEQAKSAVEDETRSAGGMEGGAHISEKKAAGKLARPKKAPMPRKITATASKGSESPKFDSFIESKANTVAMPAQVSGPSILNKETPPQVAATSRRPSINISEYSFNADTVPKQPAVSAKSAPAAKKTTVRKRASKTDDDKAKVPAPKKSRKPKAKSEAIILDSDEPEPPLFDADRVVENSTVRLDETVVKRPRSKASRKPEAKAANTEATTSEVSKTTKSCDAAEPCVRESTEKSVYFAQQEPSAALDRLPSSPPPPPSISHTIPQPQEVALADTAATTLVTETPLPPTEPAPRRRRSWTPVKDSLAENTTNTLPIVNYELNERMGQTSFSEMLGSFSFMQSETAPAPRAANGEASTKRRRVELSDMPQLAAQSVDKPKAKAAPKLLKVKKPKAVLKKPQTITDRATEAYRPLKDADPEQPTISAHFTPRKEVEVAITKGDGTGQEEAATKVKKPRKSRAKIQPSEGNAAIPTKAKAKPKTTKVKVKFDKKEHHAPLCSPTQALKQMKAQDFLFGTSSQLAAEESPDFIRDIQLAVRQSEMAFAMPNSSQIGTQLDPDPFGEGKSYAGVPTAPHGTCLSIEQARRELWCVSARDETGSKLAQEPKDSDFDAPQPASEGHAAQTHDTITISSSAHGSNAEQATTATEQAPTSKNASMLHAIEAPKTLEDRDELPSIPFEDTECNQPTTLESNIEPNGDDWMLLQSDDSVCLPQTASCPPPERPTGLATSPARRTVLQALDANVPLAGPDLLAKTNPLSQVRLFSTTVPSPERARSRKQLLDIENDDVQIVSSPKRGRGRPRKEPLLEVPAQTSPVRGRGRPQKEPLLERTAQTSPARGRGRPRKNSLTEIPAQISPVRGRGRPRKEPSLERTAQTSPARGRGRPRNNSLTEKPARTSPGRKSLLHELMAVPSPKRPVGRPRKATAQSNALPLSPARAAGSTRQEPVVVSTQPQQVFRKIPSPRPRGSASQQQTPRKEWTHIDDISDSDSPATPSPKRRRASSSPAFVRPLEFDFPEQPEPQPAIAKATNPSTAAVKPTDAVWPAMQTALFPQITKSITSAPPSGRDTDLTAAPTWHEKILLYDPIVLEDLTAWLNAQGVRTELERLKPKVKTRGRKKKDAPPEVDEWEVVRDEVKAWMVQKWCEENSVCCLWREGLRGGVKGRY